MRNRTQKRFTATELRIANAKVCRVLVCIAACLATQASANDNIKSETSHALFGAATGGAFTWAANEKWPEHRALIGFATSASLGVLGEASSRNGFSALDAGAHALGAAIGAVLTDKYLLAPVLNRQDGHATYVGVMFVKMF